MARRYGARPEIFTRLSWNALMHLASPTLPAAARETLERRIVAGERIGARTICSPRVAQGRQAGAPGRAGAADGGMTCSSAPSSYYAAHRVLLTERAVKRPDISCVPVSPLTSTAGTFERLAK